MANKTVTKTPDQWKNRNSDSWNNSDPSGRRLYFGYDAPDWAAWYRQFLEIRFTPVSACSLKVRFLAEEYAEQGSYANVVCTAYGYDENNNLVWQKNQTYYWSMTQTGDHTFTFSDIGGYTINTIVYKITSTSGNGSCTAPTASYTYNVPTLGLSVTPSSLYVGETIRCTVSEPFYQSFNVSFAYNSTVLQSFSTDASSFTQTANESWFSTAGVTGNSMQVTVTITDGLGRSASARVTVNKHTALVPSIIEPRGGSLDGGQSITFAWSSSGNGYQTQAVLQYSRDNVNWSSLATINGTGTQWTAPAGKFSAGTVYWRLRLTNNWGLTSGWVSQSFTVTINAAVVTLTAPTSGSKDGAEEITFAWTIANGSGTVNGTQMEYSTDGGISWTSLINSSGTMLRYNAPAGKFTAGSMIWRVRARDTYAGWGAWKQATITITYMPAVVTLTTPTSGSKDGGQQIAFAWTITAGGGSVNGTQMEYTSDDGLTWTSMVNSSSSVTSYNAPAGKFPAGAIKWRVRAKDSFAGWGEWKQAAITITYTPAVVTLTTPTSGSLDGAEVINFAWTIAQGSGSVTGTQMEISTDDGITWQSLLSSAEAITSYSSTVAQFPAGRMLWHVRAKDAYSGWGAWKQATITVTYSAVSQVVAVNSPTSGVYNAAAARTFTVRLDASGPVHTPFQIQTASFFWRSGETGEFTELAMTPGGNTAAVEIPAGTFPSGRIEWYASATDTTERTTETPHYVLTALQTAVEATPLSPINTIESGSGPITFRWTYGSLDGAPQGRAQLQYSRDGETWTDEHIFADITGEQTTYIAEQGTFPGGPIFWRVRSYNDAGTAGPWSAAVSFVSYSAPLVTGVTGDGKPFATITWQADGQEAYEIGIGDKTYGPYYGADVRSFTLPFLRNNGSYTIRVRAQNQYGLWSQWAENEMLISNVYRSTFAYHTEDGENAVIKIDSTAATVAPMITRQPQDVQGTEGTVIISVDVASISPIPGETVLPSRQWYYRDQGGEWTPISGGSGDAITVTCAENINGRQYRCRVYNNLYNYVGEIYSRTATYYYAAPNKVLGNPITGEFRSETGYFLITRDYEPIAKTYSPEFTDRVALGTHKYQVMQVLMNGYYALGVRFVPPPTTAAPTITASVTCPAIAPLEGGDFLSLKLSENSDREVRITEAREVEWTQYAGADYPSAEIGEGKSKAVALDVSALMSDEDFAKAFTALLGKDVIVKTPDGSVVIGPLEALDLRAPRSHRSWTFGVTQMEWSGFIDES